MFTASNQNLWLVIEFILILTVLVPTMVAFFTGAPWVPTPMVRVRRMLELANLKPGDRIYDLGCGDGRMVQEAAKVYGADAVGLELSPILFAAAKIRSFFLRSKAKILLRDFRRVNFSNAHAIVFYLLPEILKTMGPKFAAEMKPGAKIISYAFQIEGWTPVYTEPKDAARNLARIFVYEVPTSVGVAPQKVEKSQ